MQKEIDSLVSKAELNINEDKTKLAFKESDLVGLPKDLLQKLEKVKGKDGWRYVSLKKTQSGPVMKLAQNPDVRKQIEFAMGV
jgi:Zn-dependent oligopeptidase